MSVSGVPSIPGFDVLFPSGNTTSINGAASNNGSANSGTSGTGTANSAPATTTGSSAAAPSSTAQPAGFDILFPNGTVPGTSATKPPATSTANAAPASGSTAQNPYQTAYDNIETWSSGYLLNSVENGAPSSAGISTLSGGESANSFAQLNSTLAALKPLIAIEGAEQNPSTTPASTSGSSSTGSTVDSFA